MVTLARQRPDRSHEDVAVLGRATAAIAGAAALMMAASTFVQVPGVFLIYLFSSMAAVRLAYRSNSTPQATAWLIPVGYLLIAVGVVLELIARGPLSWFMFVAGPGLLGSTAGFVVWAVWARRRIRPSWAWLLLGIGGVFAIVLSEFGTTVFVAGFWLLYATRRIQIEPTPQPAI